MSKREKMFQSDVYRMQSRDGPLKTFFDDFGFCFDRFFGTF